MPRSRVRSPCRPPIFAASPRKLPAVAKRTTWAKAGRPPKKIRPRVRLSTRSIETRAAGPRAKRLADLPGWSLSFLVSRWSLTRQTGGQMATQTKIQSSELASVRGSQKLAGGSRNGLARQSILSVHESHWYSRLVRYQCASGKTHKSTSIRTARADGNSNRAQLPTMGDPNRGALKLGCHRNLQ